MAGGVGAGTALHEGQLRIRKNCDPFSGHSLGENKQANK